MANKLPKPGDIMIFTGATDDQVKWRGSDDPREVLNFGNCVVVDQVFADESYTEISLLAINGRFNSVCFKTKEWDNWMAALPDLYRENQELKQKLNDEETKRISAEVALDMVIKERNALREQNRLLEAKDTIAKVSGIN